MSLLILMKLMKKNQILKIVVFLLLSITVYIQVIKNENVDSIIDNFFIRVNDGNLLFLLLAILLMPLNWSFEYLKWRRLTKNILTQDRNSALKSVLAGITVSIFTPNRIGEYGGRMLFFDRNLISRVVLASVVGSTAQWITIVGFGLLSLFYMQMSLLGLKYNPYIVFGLAIGLYIVLILVYFNLKKLAVLGKNKSTGWRRHLKVFRIMENYNSFTLFSVLMMSTSRFLTYTFQYVLILMFFSGTANVLNLITKVMSIFLAQLAIPVPPFMAVFSRAEMALLILKSDNVNDIAVISATFLLWTINLIIPATIGFIIILKEKKFALLRRKKMF